MESLNFMLTQMWVLSRSSTRVLPTQKWYHVAGVYADGELEGSVAHNRHTNHQWILECRDWL